MPRKRIDSTQILKLGNQRGRAGTLLIQIDPVGSPSFSLTVDAGVIGSPNKLNQVYEDQSDGSLSSAAITGRKVVSVEGRGLSVDLDITVTSGELDVVWQWTTGYYDPPRDPGIIPEIPGAPAPAPPPAITSIAPTSADRGQSLSLTVTGTGFSNNPAVPQVTCGPGITVDSVIFNSATELLVNVTIDSEADAGLYDFVVINPDTQNSGNTGDDKFTVTAPVIPPPVPPTSWPSEPAGFQAITDQPWNTLASEGWNHQNRETESEIVVEPTGPLSPSNVLRHNYWAGYPGLGTEPAVDWINVQNRDHIFFGTWWKPSADWEGHDASFINKIMFFFGVNNVNSVVFTMFGSSLGPWHLRPVLVAHPDARTTYLAQNQFVEAISPGSWHRIEIEMDRGTGAGDGVIRWWQTIGIGGTRRLLGEYTDMSFASGGFTEVQHAGTFGGVGGSAKSVDNFYWFDHTYISEPVDNPVLTNATVDGTSLVLTYNETLDGTSDPAPGDMNINTDGAAQTISSVNADGTTATLVLSPGVAFGDTISIDYTPGVNPIQDPEANAAVALVAQGVTNNTADAGTPTLSSAVVNATSLDLTYNEPLDEASTPATGDYSVANSGPAQSVTGVVVTGSVVALTLSPGVNPGDTVTVDYTVGVNPVQDLEGNDAANLVTQAVTNNTPDVTAPVLSTATVDGTSLVLTYDEALDTGSTPATGDFSVGSDGPAQTVSSVGVAGSAATLTLTPGVDAGDAVTVNYTASTNPIRDPATNPAANLSAQVVTNNTVDLGALDQFEPASFEAKCASFSDPGTIEWATSLSQDPPLGTNGCAVQAWAEDTAADTDLFILDPDDVSPEPEASDAFSDHPDGMNGDTLGIVRHTLENGYVSGNDGHRLRKSNTSKPEYFFSAYLRFGTGFTTAAGEVATFLRQFNGSFPDRLEFVLVDDSSDLWVQVMTSGFTVSKSVPATAPAVTNALGEWFKFSIHMKETNAGANTEITMWINGTKILDQEEFTPDTSAGFDELRFGLIAGTKSAQEFMDCGGAYISRPV